MKQLQGKITFVGGGAMGEAIIGSLIGKKLLNPTQICVSEPVPTRREYLNSTYGVTTETDNSQAVTGASVAVLAVKPQVLGPVMADLNGNLSPAALVVSIMAGVQIDTLQSGLCHDKIVRSMPNTPAQVGKGMTVWTDTAAVTESDRATAQAILEAMGEAIYAAEEHYLDMATGLSGSGPGFVYLLLEALIDAGVHIGFSRDHAQQMVLQTVEGSVELMRHSGLHAADLRNRVTSPAGTTAAGSLVLERAGVRAALIDAVDVAYRRSRELGGSSESDGG
jgi:pyrroline-5-carboxylate reductase